MRALPRRQPERSERADGDLVGAAVAATGWPQGADHTAALTGGDVDPVAPLRRSRARLPCIAQQAADPAASDPFSNALKKNYLSMRKTTIYAGSNEIQRNIIAKMTLGL